MRINRIRKSGQTFILVSDLQLYLYQQAAVEDKEIAKRFRDLSNALEEMKEWD